MQTLHTFNVIATNDWSFSRTVVASTGREATKQVKDMLCEEAKKSLKLRSVKIR